MLDAPANSVSGASSDTPSTSNPESAATSISADQTPPHAAEPLPSLDEQVGKVLMIHNRRLKDNQEGYVISEKWLERVFARTSENKNNPEQFDKAATEGEIGPIDNSDLVALDALSEDLEDQNGDDFIPLRPGLTMGHDFEILPAEAWELILSWYGLKGTSPVIRRYVHNTALDKDLSENLQYEVYPPIFTIRKVRKSAQNSQETAKPGPKLIASRGDGVVDFFKSAKKAVGIELKSKTKFWRVLNTAPTETAPSQPSGMLTPDSSPRNGSPVSSARNPVPMIIDAASFNALVEGTERELVTSKDETANEKYNGSQTLALIGLAEDQVLILEEQDEKGEFPSDSSKKPSQKNGLHLDKFGNKANKGLQSGANSGRNSPTPSDRVTRGRTTRTGKTRGTVGLTNLGNTCYMNSALQCIRSVEELSAYFSADKWKEDLNGDNPLGHGGQIAKAYCGLLTQIYGEGTISAFAPKNFKAALGRAQPLFSGYGQQDSQEFLSFLVDGLHEDLNRVKKKPYTENPESDDNTVHDPEAIKALGEKYREIHRSRNNSVAMDLFNGFYKNTMVCPDCDKVSITFDPYSLLTLQLPIEQTWQHTVTFVPLRGSIVNVEIDIDKNATIKTLKEYIAKRFPGVKASRLMGAEVYTHKFYRVLENNKSISECNIGQRDVIYFYELDNVPTNWPPPKKKQQYRSMLYPTASSEEDIPKSASPLGDKMLVPIFHRAPNMSTYRGNAWSLVLWPSYIVLTREEAKNYDEIMRKVLGRVAQMTTRPILSELDDTPQDQSRSGSDIVLTTEEDAYPNGDPRVQDGSVEGEDNMVEVTMTEPGDVAAPAAAAAESDTEDKVPEILKPGTFINPAFHNLFEIKHTKAGKEMVPTGWSSIDSNKPYEPISKRMRTVESRQSSVQSTEGEANSNASSSDAEDAPQFSADANSSIEAANETSDEDIPAMPSVESETFARGGRANSKKNKRKNKKHQKHNKGLKTYSKKGKDRFNSQPPHSYSEPESDDEEGLIRLGEGLVLEWNQESYDALFDGNPSQNGYDDRGVDTSKDIPTYDDPELREKKAKRAARKKNGITLEECFQETSKSEVLSEDNAWYCNRCKELRRATKTLEIWTAPDILVVHLKRFSAHRTFRDKIEAFVDCPLEGLDLSGKVGLPEDRSLVYDLFAVDNHYGGLGGGHYTASARNFFDGKWYDYNGKCQSPFPSSCD
jgi:ubiquitin carboxyl-terminal hydrolase 4/11/15